MTPVIMRRKDMRTFRVSCALLGISLLIFAVVFVIESETDIFFALFLGIVGLMLILLPPVAIRRMVRKRAETALHAPTANVSITLSSAGIDTRGQHHSAHFDWTLVLSIQRIPDGMLVQVGPTTVFVAAHYFETQADFERALAIAREYAAAKFHP